jgi:hypothetical protein
MLARPEESVPSLVRLTNSDVSSVNHCCELVFVLESILLVSVSKIVLQHNQSEAGIDWGKSGHLGRE